MKDSNSWVLTPKELESLVEVYMSDTKDYLNAELEVLERVKSYQIIYDYLNQFPERVRKFVNDQPPSSPEDSELRKKYFLEVSAELYKRAKWYSPMMGSVPEDIGETLKKLADEFSQ